MRNYTQLLLFLALSCLAQVSSAQDIHFSNIHASPIHLNPAMTGIFNGGSARFIGISRSQWSSFTNGFKTMSGSIDAKLLQTSSGGFFGGGLQVFADKAGDLDFKQTYVGGSLSYVMALNKKSSNFIALGMQAAYIGNSFDMTKMVGFDQETAITFGDIDSQLNYVDVNVGAAWYYTFGKSSYYYIGGALSHVNEPNVSFFDTNTSGTQTTSVDNDGRRLYRKTTVHGGANLRLSSNITMLPSFVYFNQGPHQQINVGTYFKIQKERRGRGNQPEYAFYFGTWARFYKDASLSGIDAIIPSFRADFKNTIVSLSFDVNISDLKSVSNGAGGPELSIIKVLGTASKGRKSNKVKCPDF